MLAKGNPAAYTPDLADEDAARVRAGAAAGRPKAALAREFNISRETVYQYLRTAAPPG